MTQSIQKDALLAQFSQLAYKSREYLTVDAHLSSGWRMVDDKVDANVDGVIDASDPVFAQLKVWQHADGDAVADYGELRSMEALGITGLDYANARFTCNGQSYALQSQEIEASNDGTRVSVVPEGIRVEFSNGQATVFVANVIDLGPAND